MKNFIKLSLLSFVGYACSGCAAVALSAITMGAGYTVINVAHKTSNYSLGQVHQALVLALNKMEIAILSDDENNKGREIQAATRDLDIAIVLEPITRETTRMSVDARKATILKDKSTADEIIVQTQSILKDGTHRFQEDENKNPATVMYLLTLNRPGDTP